jgi:4-amino-4-deoxy-L-arabinose transferase-like glycosyltransferase
MRDQKHPINLSPAGWVIIFAALAKFAVHMINAPGYGLFFDEMYTAALSRHLAFGYVDLPPLVPALMALSRAVLGESLLAMHIVPALAGAATLVFVCLIVREFGGRTFAVALSALAFIVVPLWLEFDSAFCYDCIDQLILAGFLYTLIRFLRSGNRKLWILLGALAGLACLTKMTILFLGPGFLVALLISKYRRDLLTPWPWLGAALCLVIVSPYLYWEWTNHWPTLDYWYTYGTFRVYKASLPQYFINIMANMNPFLLPLYLAGLYRIFRRLKGVNYGFLGLLFLFTLMLMFFLHATVRLLGTAFTPLIAAGAVFLEEMLTGARWKMGLRALPVAYLLAAGMYVMPTVLPILPIDSVYNLPRSFKYWYQSVREFNPGKSYAPINLVGRVGWEGMVRDVAGVYDQLPGEDRRVAGIYTDWYYTASAIDMYGPRYGLPHAVSGALNYYLWGPGYSWDVMIILNTGQNYLSMFFDECTRKGVAGHDLPGLLYVDVCKGLKVSPNIFWPNLKNYH